MVRPSPRRSLRRVRRALAFATNREEIAERISPLIREYEDEHEDHEDEHEHEDHEDDD